MLGALWKPLGQLGGNLASDKVLGRCPGGGSWGSLEDPLGAPWGSLGGPWGIPGRSLGGSMEVPVGFLGVPGKSLGGPGCPRKVSGGQDDPTWATLGSTWGQLGPTWGQLGAMLGPTCVEMDQKLFQN